MKDLLGTYSIIIDGESVGELSVVQSGLTARFEGSCPDRGALVKLSVYGDGIEGYLGVMIPDKGLLKIKKTFSRSALANFPPIIEYAGPAGLADAASKDKDNEPYIGSQFTSPAIPASSLDRLLNEARSLNSGNSGGEEAADSSGKDTFWIPEPNPWALFSDQEMKNAWKNVTETLKSESNGSTLLAIPAEKAETIKGVFITANGKREIEGAEYIIFKIDEGTIL